MKTWRTVMAHLGLIALLLALLTTPVLAVDPDRSPGRASNDVSISSEPIAENEIGDDAPQATSKDEGEGVQLDYVSASARPGFYAARDNRNLVAADYNLIGGHQSFSWANLEPSEDNYQWNKIDDFITAQLSQGKQAVGIGIVIYNGRANLGSISDPPLRVPEWVFSQKGARKIYCSGGLEIPRYWDPILLTYYEDFISDLADRYDNNPNVEFVQIGVGKFMETQPCDDSDDACVLAALEADGWTQWTWPYIVNDITDIYKRHFHNTNLLLLNEPTFMSSGTYDFSRHAVDNGVGQQPAGLHADRWWVDLRTKSGFHGSGKYDWMLDQAEETAFLNWSPVPMAHEMYDYMIGGNTDLGVEPDAREFFWAVSAALSRKVDYITIERNALYIGKFNDPVVTPYTKHINVMGWANQYLGQYVNTTPSVFVLMRDTAYIDSLYPQKGNYTFYMTQDDSVPGGQTDVVTYRTEAELPGVGRSSSDVKASIITVDNEPGLSVLSNPDLSDPMDFAPSYKGWIARRTNQSTGNPRMFFKIDDRYFSGTSADATIEVTFFDKGSDSFRIVAHNAGGGEVTVQTVNKTNTYRWKTVSIPAAGVYFSNMLSGGSDFYLDCANDGDETIHKVEFRVGGSGTQTHSISLTADGDGWNFVSGRLIPQTSSLPGYLSSIDGKYALLQGFVNGSWRTYQAGFGGDLSAIDEKMGFWIKVTENCQLVVSGTAPSSTTISLSSTNGGWNLIGWPSDDTRAIGTALAGIAGQYDLVYSYDAFDSGDPWAVYSPSAPPYANDLTDVGPGQALWIHCTSNCSLTVSY